MEALKEKHPHCEAWLLDWRAAAGDERFDLILGAEILVRGAGGDVLVPEVCSQRLAPGPASAALIFVKVRNVDVVNDAVAHAVGRLGLAAEVFRVRDDDDGEELGWEPIDVDALRDGYRIFLRMSWPQ